MIVCKAALKLDIVHALSEKKVQKLLLLWYLVKVCTFVNIYP